MFPRLPSLTALHAFEAVSRHRSVSRAAHELSVTQPAVTQHLRRLEDRLGVVLVERVPGGLELTGEGRRLGARLARAFDELRAAVDEARGGARGGEALSVAVLATLAQRWLIPRLARFQDAHPGVDVRLLTASRIADLEREGLDLSIRCGGGRWPGYRADLIWRNEAFPVISPALLADRPVERPADLAGHVLIEVDAEPRRDDWGAWLDVAGAPGLEPRGRIAFSSSIHALEAAVAGLGVAIAPAPFVGDALESGRLVAPLAARLPGDGDFYVVCERRRAHLPRIAAFRDWLLAQSEPEPGPAGAPGGQARPRTGPVSAT